MDERAAGTDGGVARLRAVLARRPTRRTLTVVAIGFVGVLVSEAAAGRAPVALPMLFATGLLGAAVRHGWGGPGATWIGGALFEGVSAIGYLVTRPSADASLDGLVPLFFLAGIMLFAGVFSAAAGVAAGIRRIAAPGTAEIAIRLGVVALVGASLVVVVATP